jgi:hypothetical protein
MIEMMPIPTRIPRLRQKNILDLLFKPTPPVVVVQYLGIQEYSNIPYQMA